MAPSVLRFAFLAISTVIRGALSPGRVNVPSVTRCNLPSTLRRTVNDFAPDAETRSRSPDSSVSMYSARPCCGGASSISFGFVNLMLNGEDVDMK